MNWQIHHQLTAQDPADRLEEVRQFLLQRCGVRAPEDFFSPPLPAPASILAQLPDLDQQQLKIAVRLLKKAVKNQTPILIYGDYDCDGVCATAILWRALYDLGAKALPFIPHRLHHGYGLSAAGLEEALKQFDQKPLIVTVDNGIAAQLSDLPHPLIITDHHQPPDVLPQADAIVHTTFLSGSGVAWLLANQLSEEVRPLDLVALATVTDLLPLTGPNRSLVTHGLKELQTPSSPGLKALYQAAGIANRPIDTYHLGYILGPRINAAGRLDHALDALRLLCTTSPTRAHELAAKLSSLNQDRQQLTESLSRSAMAHFRSQPSLPNLLIFASEQFPEGIIGLIAAQLTQRFHRPSLVISLDGQLAKGSARSIPGINITQLLAQGQRYLTNFGGHDQAAGFSTTKDQLELLQNTLAEFSQDWDESLFEKTLDIDLELKPQDLTSDLLNLIRDFAPFGPGNHEPVFAVTLPIAQATLVGKNQAHLKLKPAPPHAHLDLIGFYLKDKLPLISPNAITQIAFSLTDNTFNGKTSLQLKLKDLL